MEDIQDGVKKSIQDGVEEDPEYEEAIDLTAKSFAGLIYIMEEIKCPKIEIEYELSTDSEDKVCTIGIIPETVVT